MKKRIVIFLAVLLLVTLACDMVSIDYGTQQPGTQQAPGETPQQELTTPLPVGTPPSKPVSISEGLASLNSYRSIISITTKGPDPKNSSTMVFETQRSKDLDAQVTHVTSKSIENGKPSEGDSNLDIYRIGNDQCSGSGEDWSYEKMTPNEAEMKDQILSNFSFTPATDESTFVGVETVNGISTNHFSFKVKGLGSKSGANVTINQGDYWLAVDGQYIVKYSLVVETVVDPNTDVMHMETAFEVQDINQPVTIAFPQVCLDAKTATTVSSNQATQEPSVNPSPTQAAQVNGFAGFWDTNYGDMTCTVDGENVNCTYTHNAGKIEAFINPDGKSLEGSWFEAPTYKPADHAGRLIMTLSVGRSIRRLHFFDTSSYC